METQTEITKAFEKLKLSNTGSLRIIHNSEVQITFIGKIKETKIELIISSNIPTLKDLLVFPKMQNSFTATCYINGKKAFGNFDITFEDLRKEYQNVNLTINAHDRKYNEADAYNWLMDENEANKF